MCVCAAGTAYCSLLLVGGGDMVQGIIYIAAACAPQCPPPPTIGCDEIDTKGGQRDRRPGEKSPRRPWYRAMGTLVCVGVGSNTARTGRGRGTNTRIEPKPAHRYTSRHLRRAVLNKKKKTGCWAFGDFSFALPALSLALYPAVRQDMQQLKTTRLLLCLG